VDDVQGEQQLKTGDRVVFKIFANKQGLRADGVKKIGVATATTPLNKSSAPVKGSLPVKSTTLPGKNFVKSTNGVKKTIEKSKPKPPSGAPPAKPLPKNWEEHWSAEHDVPFYWNKVTKQSAWVRPKV